MNNLTPDTALALLQTTAQSDGARATQKLQEARKSGKLDEIEKAAQDFEAVFITEMMKPMFEGIEVDAPFGGGKGEEVFRGMMLEEYGKITAQSGGLGIADHVKEAMIRMQEQIDNNTRHPRDPAKLDLNGGDPEKDSRDTADIMDPVRANPSQEARDANGMTP